MKFFTKSTCAAVLALSLGTASATIYNVGTTSDFPITTVTAATGALASGPNAGQITLRSAVIGANMNGVGPHTINVLAGTYNLSQLNPDSPGTTATAALNDLQIGSTGSTITVVGNGGTGVKPIIVQMVGGNDVITTGFKADYSPAIVTLTLDNLEITGGTFTGIFTGADDGAGNRANTTITRCNIHHNTNGDATNGQGGAIYNQTGSLTLTNNTITNNTATNSAKGQGGAVFYNLPNAAGQGSTGTFTATGNSLNNNSSSVSSGIPAGGAIFVAVASGDANGGAININNNIFSANSATGGGDGGAVAIANGAGRTTNLLRNTFLNNSVTPAAAHGGAVVVSSGLTNVNFNRFNTNNATTAANGKVIYHPGAAAEVNANDNWWGTSVGPAGLNFMAGNFTQTNWLQLKTTATTPTITTNGATTYTASFLTDSANNVISVANLAPLINVVVSTAGTGGTAVADQIQIQANGTVTGTYSETTGVAGTHSVTVRVDNDPLTGSTNTASITVNKANVVTTILSDAPDPSVTGQAVAVGFSVAAANGNTPTAPTGNVSVTDGTSSGTGTVSAGTANISLASGGAKTLTATYAGDANFNASPASAGAGHTVNKAATTTTMTSHTPNPSLGGNAVVVNFTVTAAAPGSGTPTGNVTISDGTDSVVATVAAGTGSVTLNTVGARTLTATYSGDANYNGSASAGTAHDVNAVPVVTMNPASQTILAGNTVTFSAAASGTPTPTVQWKVSTNSGASFSNIVGATTAPLTFTVTAADQGNLYLAVFTNTAGSISTSAATLTVTVPPTVSTNPTNVTVNAGAAATFTAAASGSPTPTVQWQFSTDSGGSFSNVAGATSTTFNIPSTVAAQNGHRFRAVFTNGGGNATTTAATLTINLPEINLKGNMVTIVSGDTTPATTDGTDFGSSDVGMGVLKQFQIENLGTAFLNLTGTPRVVISGTNAADFVVSTQPSTPVVAPDAVTWGITFTPSAGGLRTASVSIANNDPNENPYTFSIQGTGITPGLTLTVSPASVLEDGVGNLLYTFTRSGSTAAAQDVNFAISGTATRDTDYTLSGASVNAFDIAAVTIPVGQASATVTVNPTADALVEADETVIFTLGESPGITNGAPTDATGTITNDDVAAPEIVVTGGLDVEIVSGDITPSNADGTEFGSLGIGSATNTFSFSILNTGTADITLTGTPRVVISGTNAADFTVVEQSATPILPNDHSGFQITFQPTGIGLRTATVTIASNDADENPYTFAIQGTGQAPVISVYNGALETDPALTDGQVTAVDFGVPFVGASADRNFLVKNTGTQNLILSSITLPSRYTLVTAFAGQSITPNGTYGFTVRYTPNSAGTTNSGSVQISSNDLTASVFDFPVIGMGEQPSVTVTVSPASVLEDGLTNLVYTFTRNGPTTQEQEVHFEITGNADRVTDYTVSGATVNEFGIGTVTIPAGQESAMVTVDPIADTIVEIDDMVIFTLGESPGIGNGQPSDAMGTITNDDVLQPEIAVSGNGNNIPYGSGTTSSDNGTHFGGALLVGGTVVQTFTITNTGDAPLALGPILITGTEFTVSSSPVSPVAAGSSTTFQVTFDPEALGLRSATLSFTTNDFDEPFFNFRIAAFGANNPPTDISLNNSFVNENNFANTTVGTLGFTDANVGDTPTFSLFAGAGGTDNGSFTLAGNVLKITPSTDFETKSSYSIRLNVNDGNGGNFSKAFTVTILNLNETPSFTKGGNQSHPFGTTSAQTVAGWATAIDDGDSLNTQAVHFNVTVTSGSGIFTTAPSISPTGTLTYKPNGTAGTATVSVSITDDTSVDEAGALTSAAQTFTITLSNNTPPTITDVTNQTINEDSATTALPFTIGDAETAVTALTVTSGSSNTTLVPLANLVLGGSGASRTVTVTPAADQFGTTTITLTVNDGTTSTSDTFDVIVRPIADTPSITNVTTNEDTQSTTGLVISRNPVDGSEVTHFKITGITNGTLFQNDGATPISNGAFIAFGQASAGLKFMPPTDFNGTGNITVQASTSSTNAGLGGSTVTATITVNPVNDAPSFTIGPNQSAPYQTSTQQTLTGWATSLSKGPANESAQTLSFQITNNTNAALFTVAPSINPAGNLTYTPTGNSGTATISVVLQDNGGTASGGVDTSAVQTFTITVLTGPDITVFNGASTAAADERTDNVGTFSFPDTNNLASSAPQTFTIKNTGPANLTGLVLSKSGANASDYTFSALGASTLALNTTTTFTVTFTPSAIGTRTATVTIASNDPDENPFEINLTGVGVNTAPVAAAQSVTTDEDINKAITLTATDAESIPLTYNVLSGPSHGSLTGTAPNVTYVPTGNYNGPDSFTFKANDGFLDSNTATVSITVNAVNDPPIAENRTYTITEGGNLRVLLSASDADNDNLSYYSQGATSTGTNSGIWLWKILDTSTQKIAPTRVSYTSLDFFGTTVFSFQVSDGQTLSNVATITVIVLPVNDEPVAAAQSVSTREDVSKDIILTGEDVDGDQITFSIAEIPFHGSLSGTAPNVRYTPELNYNGPDSFTFKVNDGTVDSFAATVSINVTPVNDTPTLLLAISNVLQTRPALTSTENLSSHFSDAETASTALVYSITNSTLPGFYTASIVDATLTLTSTAPGITTFTVRATDPRGLFAETTFTYRVKHLPEVVGSIPNQVTSIGTPLSLDVASYFQDKDSDSITYSIVANTIPAVSAASLTDSTLSLSALMLGSTNLTLRATDSDGGTAETSFKFTIGTVFPTVTSAGTLTLERQTGLFVQTVQIKNTTARPSTGFRLCVTGLSAGVTLYSASSAPGVTPAYVDYPYAMTVDQIATLTLTYLVPNRMTNFTPVLTVKNIPSGSGSTAGTGAGLAVERLVRLGPDALLLEFSAVAGHWYQIEYSSDLMTWKLSPTPILAGANRVQWIDRGPAYTDSPPSTATTRYYRVREIVR